MTRVTCRLYATYDETWRTQVVNTETSDPRGGREEVGDLTVDFDSIWHVDSWAEGNFAVARAHKEMRILVVDDDQVLGRGFFECSRVMT
jgi:hypothetical protein